MLPFYVYILKCRDGSYYVGHTDNLYDRIKVHNAGTLKGYTSTRLPVELLWVHETETRQEAFTLEHKIKKWSRLKKEALIKGDKELLKEFSKKNFNSCHNKRTSFLWHN